MITPQRAWYLVHTKPRQEVVAEENLQRQGYEVYLPRMKAKRRRAGRLTKVVEPMFPRYLFIYLSDQTDNWSPIRSTLGVANLVRFSLYPARVPDTLIDTLKASESEDGMHADITIDYKEGDKVRFTAGPMQGYEAIFKARTGQERVLVLIEIAGQIGSVKTDEGQIEKV